LTISTSKKALVERFDREALQGFVNTPASLQPDGLELLSIAGAVSLIPWVEVKIVRFIREFQTGKVMPERHAFLTRPKSEGLWVRLHFRDGNSLEGVLPNNLLLWEPRGFTMAPPDATGNTQKVFVPRQALQSVQVLGVIGSPLHTKRATEAKRQIGLFDGS
jgi:hypothetical protein